MRKLTRRELLVAGGAAAVATGMAFRPGPTGARSAPYEEKVVAGTEHDFMIVRHVQIEGTQREIGRAIATIARNRHHARLQSTEPALLKARKDWFEAHYPAMAERAVGVTEAFLDAHDSGNDPFGLTYDMGGQPGCSTVYYPGNVTESGHATLSRNYDFPTKTFAELTGRAPGKNDRAFTADPYILELHPKQGLASLAIVSYDLLCGCLDGVNEKGLAVALLADDVSGGASPASGAQAGLGEIELPRFLLDTCATVSDVKAAVKDLKRYYTFVPCHYIVGDVGGRSCVVEWSVPDGVLHVTDGGGATQIVTNHLVSQYTDRTTFPTDRWPAGSFNRYCRLQDEIARTSGKLTTDRIKAINRTVQAGPLNGPPEAVDDPKPGRTLWHAVYDLVDHTAEVSFYLGESNDRSHGQRRTDYLRFKL